MDDGERVLYTPEQRREILRKTLPVRLEQQLRELDLSKEDEQRYIEELIEWTEILLDFYGQQYEKKPTETERS